MSAQVALTEDEFKKALPAKVKKSINSELITRINNAMGDPDMYETYRENLLSYGKVMAEGRFKITNYIDAVKYVSYKLMGKTNIASYSMTFPEKLQRFALQQVADKDIASYVAAYNKSKLVSLIMEQTLVPAWVLNQDLYQKALNVQAELMTTARSEKVRADAANSLLVHLKQPEAQKVELNVGVSEDSSIQQLREATLALAAEQRLAIKAGQINAAQAASAPIVIEHITLDG